MWAAHEGAPPVLRDSAPGLPKKGPPWSIEGEPGGRQIFESKRPFEAENEGNTTGHTSHHENEPCRIQSPSASSAPHIPNHLPQACTHHRGVTLKPPAILTLRPIKRACTWKKTRWKHIHLRHFNMSRHPVTRATPHLAHQLHHRPCTSNKSLISLHCMQDAFHSSSPTVYEMRGGVECTAFVRTWPCLPAHAHICFVPFDYLVDYPLAIVLHI